MEQFTVYKFNPVKKHQSLFKSKYYKFLWAAL